MDFGIVKTAYAKAITLFLSAILLAGGVYTVQHQASVSEPPKDSFTSAIQENSDLINQAVIEVVQTEGPIGVQNLKYRTNVESVLGTVRGQNLEAEHVFNALSQSQRELNLKYREFLHEAANVLIACDMGEKPDMARMNAAKAALY